MTRPIAWAACLLLLAVFVGKLVADDSEWEGRIAVAVDRLETQVAAMDGEDAETGSLDARLRSLDERVRRLEGATAPEPLELPSDWRDRTARLLALSKATTGLESRVKRLAEDEAEASGAAPTRRRVHVPQAVRTSLVERRRDLATRAEKLIVECPRCYGRGLLSHGVRLESCPDCRELPWSLRVDIALDVFYWSRTPAYRDRFGLVEVPPFVPTRSRRELGLPSEIDALLAGAKSTRVTFADETHAVTGVERSETLRWTRTADEDGSDAWFLYDARVDGPWPGDAHAGAAPAPKPPPTLSDATAERIRAKWAENGTGFRLVSLRLMGDSLLARFVAQPARVVADPEGCVSQDAVAAIRTLYEIAGPRGEVQTEWWRMWRDALGRTRLRATWKARLTRATYERIVWENLSPHEQSDLLEWEIPDQDGWIPWPMPDQVSTEELEEDDAPGPGPGPAVQIDKWVRSGELLFPPSGTYKNLAGLRFVYEDGLDEDIAVGSERFDIEVVEGPTSMRLRRGPAAPEHATLRICVPESGQPLPAKITLRLFAGGSKDTEYAWISGEVRLWADGVLLSGVRENPIAGVLHEGRHITGAAAVDVPLDAALRLAQSRVGVLQFGGDSGITVRLCPAALDVLRDLLSRYPR